MASNLGPRLKKVADLVSHGARLADIGSDHAYLPIYLVEEGKCDFALAGEVVEGPFQAAQASVRAAGLDQKIEVRLGNGTQVIQAGDRIDTLTICGMGGELIASILDQGHKEEKLQGIQHLILQANVAENLVRAWLFDHGYQIEGEWVVEDNHRLYEIIQAGPAQGKLSYSPMELQFGPLLTQDRPELAKRKWRRQLDHLKAVQRSLLKAQAPDSSKLDQINQQMTQLEELIKPNETC